MFLSAPVSLSAELLKNYLTDFHKIRRKGGILATEETIRLNAVVMRITLR